jgi:hypothetical protein
MMNFSLVAAGSAPADGVVGGVQLWTMTTRFALGIEILWIVVGLALLFWLTKPPRADVSRPKQPTRRRTGTRDDDGVPPLAA